MFNQRMRQHAHEQGFILNEYSLRKLGVTGKILFTHVWILFISNHPSPLNSIHTDTFTFLKVPHAIQGDS